MLLNCIWQIYYRVLFRLACLITRFIKLPLHGSLVAIWHGGRILLIQKSYQKGWSIPGGLRKKGETWEEAAVRETMEEVGLHLEQGRLSFVSEVIGDLGAGNQTRLFEVEISDSIEMNVDGREIVFAEFVTLNEAFKRDLSETIKEYLMTRVTLPQKKS